MIAELDTHPDAAQLQGNRLFAGLTSEDITNIGCDVQIIRCEKDEVLFREGELGDCLYLVIEGSVRISKLGRGGQQETLGFIQPGNFFGEMALIDGQPRSAQATAAGDAILGRMDVGSFERILENAPRDLHMNFLRSVVERLRGLNSHFITELMRTERLSTVGTMANSIIHDLKNPIQALQSCADLINERCTDPAMKSFTKIMRRAVDNMTDMVQELLDFARGQSSLMIERQPARAVLEELDSQLVRLIPEKVHLVRDVQCCDDIRVDVGRFVRVLLNLVKNSLEAMPKGGVLRLELFQFENTVTFRVADTGGGIPAELLPKIFEPFVTYGKSKGTGLGMAIVKSVVEAHGGAIEVRSKVEVGTTVEITLPAIARDAVESAA
jgi:signal transduction histidine kinase